MVDNDSLSEFLASAVDAAQKAGEIIRKGFYQTKNVEHKGQVDLVTETDKACEELIFNHLKQFYPTHKFIGEETTAAYGTTELTEEPTWIVDPLDGTTNFVHGFPFVCVSIGLTIGKTPTIGVVYNPIINELFTGIRGKGAFLNGNPIKVSSQTELISSLLATEAGTKRDKETVDASINRIKSLLFKVRSLRMSGSCALNLCGIACGRLDVFFELGFGGPWDVAGGAVIVREAGGVVFDPSGADFDITSQRVAASNPFLKDALVDTLRQMPQGPVPPPPQHASSSSTRRAPRHELVYEDSPSYIFMQTQVEYLTRMLEDLCRQRGIDYTAYQPQYLLAPSSSQPPVGRRSPIPAVPTPPGPSSPTELAADYPDPS